VTSVREFAGRKMPDEWKYPNNTDATRTIKRNRKMPVLLLLNETDNLSKCRDEYSSRCLKVQKLIFKNENRLP
jgi:hypothetical protein